MQAAAISTFVDMMNDDVDDSSGPASNAIIHTTDSDEYLMGMDMEELLAYEVNNGDAKAGTDVVEQIAVAAESSPSSPPDIKRQLLLLKKSSFRKQTSQRATSMSDDDRVESPPTVEPEEESVEVPDEEHVDAAATAFTDPTESFSASPRTVEAGGRSVSPRQPVRTVVLGQNNPVLSAGQRRTVRAAPPPSSSAVHTTSSSSYAARLKSRRHSSPPPANAHHSSLSSVDHDVGDDCDDSPSADHHEAPHDAAHFVHHKPPIPRQDPTKLQAHRLRRLKVERKEAKKRKALAWGKVRRVASRVPAHRSPRRSLHRTRSTTTTSAQDSSPPSRSTRASKRGAPRASRSARRSSTTRWRRWTRSRRTRTTPRRAATTPAAGRRSSTAARAPRRWTATRPSGASCGVAWST